jgi:hypothetical protein
MIPDNQPTVNRAAKKPKMAIAEANAMLDQLGLHAMISDPASAKKKTTCVISSQNPKRWDLNIETALSGNSNVKSTKLSFGFFYGTAAVVA